MEDFTDADNNSYFIQNKENVKKCHLIQNRPY